MDKIEKLREELHTLLQSCERGDVRVIAKSEELDKEIINHLKETRSDL